MVNKNKYKLNMYDLMYRNPIGRYVTENDGQKEVNILYIGEGEYAVETFKVMFWAAQYPGVKINITLACEENDLKSVKEALFDEKKLPELGKYIKMGYINGLDFISVHYKDNDSIIGGLKKKLNITNCNLTIKKCFSGSTALQKHYSFIILATGAANYDWVLGAIAHDVLAKNYKNSKHIIAAYSDINYEIEQNAHGIERDIVDIISFKKEYEDIVQSDMFRLASNVNLAYSMKYDQKLSVRKTRESFLEKFRKEFFEGDLRYDSDSSYASAVHISAKLYYCDGDPDVSMDHFLGNISDKRNFLHAISQNRRGEESMLYNELIALEHRRWNAYMVALGYRAPRDEEDWKKILKARKTSHVDAGEFGEEDRIHICLCESPANGLNKEMNTIEYWKKQPENPDDLDGVSWKFHDLTSRETESILAKGDFWLRYSFLNGIQFSQLSDAIKGLFNEHSNSVNIYEKIYYTVLAEEEINNKQLYENLCVMHEELKVVINRNKKIDFYGYDAQLVDLLPFCLWYGTEDYRNAVVLSQGNAEEDIIIPTLLYVEKAYFIIETRESTEKYEKRLKQFFENRGENTEVVIKKWNTIDDISKIIESIRKETVGKLVFHGDQLTQYREEDPLLSYNANLQMLLGENDLFAGMNRQSLSVAEYMCLRGGDIISTGDYYLPDHIYSKLKEIFLEGTQLKKKNNKYYTPWGMNAEFIQNGRKKESDIFNREDVRRSTILNNAKEIVDEIGYPAVETAIQLAIDMNEEKKIYFCRFDADLEEFQQYNLHSCLEQLNELCLLQILEKRCVDDRLYVSFVTYEITIKNFFEEAMKGSQNLNPYYYEVKTGKYLKAGASLIEKKSLKITLEDYGNKPNVILDDHRKNEHIDFIRMMADVGLCTCYEGNDGLYSVAIFKNREYLNLFYKIGEFFENVFYKSVRQTGLFDDVQKSVELVWDNEKSKINRSLEMKRRLAQECNGEYYRLCTFRQYESISSDIFKDAENLKNDNEIDCIATRGMQAYLISCKAVMPSYLKQPMIEEVKREAKLMKAKGILALFLNKKDYHYKKTIRESLKIRIKETSEMEKELEEYGRLFVIFKEDLLSDDVTRKAMWNIIQSERGNMMD